jgi:hypothetical protein
MESDLAFTLYPLDDRGNFPELVCMGEELG